MDCYGGFIMCPLEDRYQFQHYIPVEVFQSSSKIFKIEIRIINKFKFGIHFLNFKIFVRAYIYDFYPWWNLIKELKDLVNINLIKNWISLIKLHQVFNFLIKLPKIFSFLIKLQKVFSFLIKLLKSSIF
jgi:hypothetical protein